MDRSPAAALFERRHDRRVWQFEFIKTGAADFDAAIIKDTPETILNEPHFLDCAELQIVCRAADEATAVPPQSAYFMSCAF